MRNQLKGALFGIVALLFFGLAGALVAQNDTTTGRVWGPNLTLTGLLQGSRLISTVATGTAPLTVTSTTNVPNLNASLATTQSQGNNSTSIATTAYTDLAVSNALAGTNPAVAVLAASTASLTGTYNNGASGVGATFTVTATGTFSLDGTAINTIGQRVLLKNQASGFQNGVYTATVVGAVAVSPVFTRALDYNQPSDINNTGAIPVQTGTVNISTSWLLTSTVNSVGTDALTYVQFSLNPATTTSTICSGTVTLGTGALSTATKGNGSTSACSGLATTDAITNTANAEIFTLTGFTPSANGILTISCWPTANTVNCEEENNTAGTITPAAVTVNYRVVR